MLARVRLGLGGTPHTLCARGSRYGADDIGWEHKFTNMLRAAEHNGETVPLLDLTVLHDMKVGVGMQGKRRLVCSTAHVSTHLLVYVCVCVCACV